MRLDSVFLMTAESKARMDKSFVNCSHLERRQPMLACSRLHISVSTIPTKLAIGKNQCICPQSGSGSLSFDNQHTWII
jgi:hypothetical protein